MGVSRQEYWSGLPCRPPGDLPIPGVKPTSLSSSPLAGRFFTTVPPGKHCPWSPLRIVLESQEWLTREEVQEPCYVPLPLVIKGRRIENPVRKAQVDKKIIDFWPWSGKGSGGSEHHSLKMIHLFVLLISTVRRASEGPPVGCYES